MGRHFGDLAKVRHVISYSLSPFEQRAFPHFFSKGIPNVWRRFRGQVFKVVPQAVMREHEMCKAVIHTCANYKCLEDLLFEGLPYKQYSNVRSLNLKAWARAPGPPRIFAFVLSYIVYSWGTQVHSDLKKKDLSLYENDQ